MIVLLIILSLCLLCARVLAQFTKKAYSTDEYFHLYLTRLIKNKGHRLPKVSPHILGTNHECSYPYLYHKLLSYLPERVLDIWAQYGGFIFDSLSAISITIVAINSIHGDIQNVLVLGFVSISLYLTAPALTFHSIGPRAYHLTPRNFSQFINAISFCCLVLWYSFDCLIGLLGFVFLISINLLASRFYAQFFYLSAFLLALMTRNITILLIPLASSLVACLLSKNFYIFQIKKHWDHIKRYTRYKECYEYRGNWKLLLSHIKNLNIRGIWYEVILINPLLAGLFKNADLVLIFYHYNELVGTSPINLYVYLLISGIILYLITSFGIFRILGEAERYLEYLFPIKWFIILFLFYNSVFILSLIGIYHITLFMYNLWFTRNDKRNYQTNIIEIMNRLPSNGVVLSLNIAKAFTFQKDDINIICETFCNIAEAKEYEDYTRWLLTVYPYISPPNLADICQRYKVTHIINDKQTEQNLKKHHGQVYDYSKFELIFENHEYQLFKMA